MKPLLRRSAIACLGSCLYLLSGCHSAFIQATVTNRTDKPIRLFEVDYPSASFGSGELAPGASFRYRFKIIGEGATKLSWTDAAEGEHTAPGPRLQEGQEGKVSVTINSSTASWESDVHQAH